MGKNKVIVIVGDVHGDWNTELDVKAVAFLKADLVLFVGDFGDENVDVVREVSKLGMPKAVTLGNHDCCYSTHGLSGATKSPKSRQANNGKKWLRVEQQMEALGGSYVGYNRKDYPNMKASLVGLRPFAGGGPTIYNGELVSHLYGVGSMEDSVHKMMKLVSSAPKGHSLIFLGHNGPTGLGSQRNDICGLDTEMRGGDWGDPDTGRLLQLCQDQGIRVTLVVFGHMHRDLLRIPGKRSMCVVKNKTVYVNAAVVPRVIGTKRNFTVVELSPDASTVVSVTEKWVDVACETEPRLASQTVLYTSNKRSK